LESFARHIIDTHRKFCIIFSNTIIVYTIMNSCGVKRDVVIPSLNSLLLSTRAPALTVVDNVVALGHRGTSLIRDSKSTGEKSVREYSIVVKYCSSRMSKASEASKK
jgi:hypothetical protein